MYESESAAASKNESICEQDVQLKVSGTRRNENEIERKESAKVNNRDFNVSVGAMIFVCKNHLKIDSLFRI